MPAVAPHANVANLPPALKFALRSKLAPAPAPAGPQVFTLTLRILVSKAGACADLRTLCGGARCLVALADPGYKNCPSYTPRAGA